MKIKEISKIVEEIMRTNESTRDDLNLLYVETIYKLKPELVNSRFGYVFTHYKELNLPAFESVSRTARKIRERYPELQASAKVQQARENKELEILDYAKGVN